MRSTEYTKDELNREARSAVKGRGKLLRWTIYLSTSDNGDTFPSLKVYYQPHDEETGVSTVHVTI